MIVVALILGVVSATSISDHMTSDQTTSIKSYRYVLASGVRCIQRLGR
jgi:hypothetical protein